MDVKFTFLNGYLNKEVFVVKPKEFIDLAYPKKYVYKLRKALYGLKQALRGQYDYLVEFLTLKGYSRGGVDKIIFIKKSSEKFLIAQIYVDDIIF